MQNRVTNHHCCLLHTLMIYQLWKHNAIIKSGYLYVTKLDKTFITFTYFFFRNEVTNVTIKNVSVQREEAR
jgi:hypothetical protein